MSKSSKPNPMQRKYILLNGVVMKRLRANRSKDIYVAQNMETKKVETFSYKVVRDTHVQLFPTPEVAQILGVSLGSLRYLLQQGNMTLPRKADVRDVKIQPYAEKLIAQGETGRGANLMMGYGKSSYLFTPEEIMTARDVYANYKKGRAQEVPTRDELRAMLDQDVVLYVKTKNGFVPTWKAEKF